MRLERAVRLLVIVTLALAATALLVFVHRFALTRFFTIDEYQWGHATWLVHEGKVPYRDFYEHHLPLGYIVHSLFLSDAASFTENALLLRKIAFAYIVFSAALLGLAAFVVRRDPFESLLSAVLPLSVGFGLMSAIDYRGDNWSAFAMIGCFSILELNQRWRRGGLAALAGLLFSSSVLFTQKALVLGGPAIALMLVVSFWGRIATTPPRGLARLRALQIHAPTCFCAAAAAPVFLLAACGGWLGALEPAFEITFVQALQHEQLYPGFSAWRYLEPYLRYAPVTTAAIAAFAVAYPIFGADRFWVLPTSMVLAGGMGIKAPYPYNFVLLCALVGLCSVRGYCSVVRRVTQTWPRLTALAPALYLLPLSLVPAQLGFVEGSTTNVEQLETLRLIEANTAPDDVVIDSEGGALFRPDRGYYWYQGAAHVKMFAAYYGGAFVDDLRATRAIFWIDGFRTNQLPDAAKDYLYGHYVRQRGDLFVLGRQFPGNTSREPVTYDFDVVRSGPYHLSRQTLRQGEGTEVVAAFAPGVHVDGHPMEDGGTVHLEPGLHRLSIGAGAPAHRLAYLPSDGSSWAAEIGRHAPLFEYRRWR